MNPHILRRLIMFGLVFFVFITFGNVAISSESSKSDARKKAFSETMLRHGEEAYRIGDYDKAGYYLQQAIQADASRLAQIWFKLKGIETADTSAPTTKVTPSKDMPAKAPLPKQEASGDDEVVIADDEGC